MARATTARTRTARKPAARKASTRRSAATETSTRQSTPRMQLRARDVAFAQLGLAGRVYDEFTTRLERARKDAPRQWGALVKRGEQVQRDVEKAGKELRRDIETRVNSTEVKARLEQRVHTLRKAVDKLARRARKAA